MGANMIVCWSVKGGSGTTVVSAALAFALSNKHASNVRIIDLAGDMPAAIGMTQPTGPGIAEWLADDEADFNVLDNLVVPVTARIGVIPRGNQRVHNTAPHRLSALGQAVALSATRTVVDAGSGDCMTPLAQHASMSILVIRPCYLALRRASVLDHTPHAVVLVSEPGRVLGKADVESVVGAPVIAEISLDPAVARAVDAGLLAGRIPTLLAQQLANVA
jgi:Mrp family chromosome partitioning ATPase